MDGTSRRNRELSRVKMRFVRKIVIVVIVVQNCVTALHVASKWGHRNIVQLLLNSGADIDCPTGVCQLPHYTYYIVQPPEIIRGGPKIK